MGGTVLYCTVLHFPVLYFTSQFGIIFRISINVLTLIFLMSIGNFNIIVSGTMCNGLCSCNGHIIDCKKRKLTTLPGSIYNTNPQIRVLLLSENTLSLKPTDFQGLHWLSRLNISHNRLSQIVPLFSDLANLLILDLSYNNIQSLTTNSTFAGLLSLQVLDLSNNFIQTIRKETFAGLISLRHLILHNNQLNDFTLDAFSSLVTLAELNSDEYKFCCIATQVDVCTPEADEFSSCEDLMANFPLQISIWVLGFLAFGGNLFVMIWRAVTEKFRVSSFLIFNLGASDFLMGLYLLIIASADVHYRGSYIMYSDSWRLGPLCSLAGVLATLSSEASVYMLTIITLDRVITLVFPFKWGTLRMKHVKILVAVGWVAAFLISIIPVIPSDYFQGTFFSRTGRCIYLYKKNLFAFRVFG